MSNISIDYGNWVPKNLLYILLGFIIIISILSIIPMLLILKIILWILDGLFIVGLLFLYYLYRIFARNNGEMQKNYEISFYKNFHGMVKEKYLILEQEAAILQLN